MTDDAYLFIDGNYVRDKHRNALLRIFTHVPEINLLQVKSQAGAKRVFSMTARTTLEAKRKPKQTLWPEVSSRKDISPQFERCPAFMSDGPRYPEGVEG